MALPFRLSTQKKKKKPHDDEQFYTLSLFLKEFYTLSLEIIKLIFFE